LNSYTCIMIRTIILLIVTLVLVPLAAWYLDSPPTELQWTMIQRSAWGMLGVALTCFTLSTLTGNCSQVDKIWSIVPIGYTWYYAWEANEIHVTCMAVLATLWGIRLTYNFSRRGAYTWKFWAGEEDYRWEVLRANPMFNTKLKWTLFNLFFISLYQNALIWLFTLPAVYAAGAQSQELKALEILFYVVFIAFLVIETIADQQQWNFQTEKYRRIASGEPLGEYAHGFVRTGLWQWVRHPNYASEQAIWIAFFLAGAAATGNWLNWSAAGCLLLVLLFQGSSDFSENISKNKYSEYADYMKITGRFLPKLF